MLNYILFDLYKEKSYVIYHLRRFNTLYLIFFQQFRRLMSKFPENYSKQCFVT